VADTFAVIAEFDTPAALLAGVRTMRKRGFAVEAFSPYPLDGLDEAIGFRSNRVPLAFLLGGMAGAAVGFGMQVWLNYLFPLWIGGRPLVAVPGYMMITFELMVLCSVLSGVLTMMLSNRLPKLHHPVFDFERFDLSAERFYLAILAGPDFNRDEAGKALAELDPVAIGDVPEQPA
jgi:hypothetical protein